MLKDPIYQRARHGCSPNMLVTNSMTSASVFSSRRASCSVAAALLQKSALGVGSGRGVSGRSVYLPLRTVPRGQIAQFLRQVPGLLLHRPHQAAHHLDIDPTSRLDIVSPPHDQPTCGVTDSTSPERHIDTDVGLDF